MNATKEKYIVKWIILQEAWIDLGDQESVSGGNHI